MGRMRAHALMDRASSEAIDIYLRREDADAARGDLLRDEPTWAPDFSVVEIELDERQLSAN
jgi:hypothetical protein